MSYNHFKNIPTLPSVSSGILPITFSPEKLMSELWCSWFASDCLQFISLNKRFYINVMRLEGSGKTLSKIKICNHKSGISLIYESITSINGLMLSDCFSKRSMIAQSTLLVSSTLSIYLRIRIFNFDKQRLQRHSIFCRNFR